MAARNRLPASRHPLGRLPHPRKVSAVHALETEHSQARSVYPVFVTTVVSAAGELSIKGAARLLNGVAGSSAHPSVDRDLTGVRFTTPFATAALAAALHGWPLPAMGVRLFCPEDPNRKRYLAASGFLQAMAQVTELTTRLWSTPAAQRHLPPRAQVRNDPSCPAKRPRRDRRHLTPDSILLGFRAITS